MHRDKTPENRLFIAALDHMPGINHTFGKTSDLSPIVGAVVSDDHHAVGAAMAIMYRAADWKLLTDY